MKHTHIRGIIAGGVTTTNRIEVEGDAEIAIEEAVPIGNNLLQAFTLDVSQLQSIFITADGALTIETNSAGSPVNVITLAANQPFFWRVGDGTLRDTAGTAITTDITALYFTNATAAAVNLILRALYDPTV